MTWNRLKKDLDWTLFMDRDGIINRLIVNGYVTKVEDFEFQPGSLKAIRMLKDYFQHIIIVTNQQGIGKGLMTEDDLMKIHGYMLSNIESSGGYVDAVYFCPELEAKKNECRKPRKGMALQAKKDFPNIDFSKSIMVGDSITDAGFGKNIGAVNVLASDQYEDTNVPLVFDYQFNSLLDFAMELSKAQ